MANVEMSPNPKRIRVFIGGDGKLYEGGAEDNLGGKAGSKLGANPGADSLPKKDEGSEKEKK